MKKTVSKSSYLKSPPNQALVTAFFSLYLRNPKGIYHPFSLYRHRGQINQKVSFFYIAFFKSNLIHIRYGVVGTDVFVVKKGSYPPKQTHSPNNFFIGTKNQNMRMRCPSRNLKGGITTIRKWTNTFGFSLICHHSCVITKRFGHIARGFY